MNKNTTELTVSFPEGLRQLRREKDWSQGRLAAKAGIGIQRISKYEERS